MAKTTKSTAKPSTIKKAVKKTTPSKKLTSTFKKTLDPGEHLCSLIVDGMKEIKAQDIVNIDLRNVKNAVADFFIICHASSKTQRDAIAKKIEEIVYKAIEENPLHREGFTNAEWILLDYGNVVAHIFETEKRSFYALESLWADADIQHISAKGA